jgi:hypothetical protein
MVKFKHKRACNLVVGDVLANGDTVTTVITDTNRNRVNVRVTTRYNQDKWHNWNMSTAIFMEFITPGSDF